MFSRIATIALLFIFIGSAALLAAGQKRSVARGSTSATKAQKTAAGETQSNTNSSEASEPIPTKRNDRPKGETVVAAASTERRSGSEYEYLFFQPNFTLSRVLIRHNDLGKGTIEFMRADFEEPMTEAIEISGATLARLNSAYADLKFLESNESYQHEKDFSHLGTIRLTLVREDKKRTAEFNWTDNRLAKSLADEYRKIANQFVWTFDIDLARQNQPLESPKLISRLESFLRRNEISDPVQLLPLLTALANDERLPLIARNHTLRLIGQIKKSAK